MIQYARASLAYGFCDRCGTRWDLTDLKFEVVDQQETTIKVCPDCFDKDHPQLRLGDLDLTDPMILRDPRPDTALTDSRSMFSWSPVGNLPALEASVGTVEMTV